MGTLANHFNPKYYPEPLKFNPDRWLNKTENDPHTFTPFSGGQRSCIGKHLALTESKIIIATVVDMFHIGIREGYEPILGMG